MDQSGEEIRTSVYKWYGNNDLHCLPVDINEVHLPSKIILKFQLIGDKIPYENFLNS